MRKILTIILFAVLLLPAGVLAQEAAKEAAPAVNAVDPILKIKDCKNWQSCFDAYNDAVAQCKSYEDYEKLFTGIKELAAKPKNKECADITYYTLGRIRVEELSVLTKKNDIESGRIYMSVNEKYYNEALEDLDKAEAATKSKDLSLDIYLLKFSIFKELFQPQKVDAIFNEMVNRIASYTGDKARNIAKLNEMSKRFSDRGMGDYAMKLKFVYASKVDPESAKMLAEEIRSGGDKYLQEGNIKEAMSTYDTYIQLAENYYDQDSMSAKIMEIAEKYFEKKRYKDAIKYYSLYLFKYGASRTADYASYKCALSYYNDKDYPNAVTKFEEFLNTYQNSVWFEKGFEALCRVYYETSNTETAIVHLQKLIDAYPRRDTRDYAYLLIGILNYSKPDYDKALEVLKKTQTDFPRSAYSYAIETLINDINDIKKGMAPSYSFGSKEVYRIWEPYMPIGASVTLGEGASAVENKDAKPGEVYAKMKCGSKASFTIAGIEDLDRFSEYMQDKEDQSRLPREIKTGTEKDLIFFTWSGTEGGKFTDEKQTLSKTWQAPDAPGDYTITINAGDMALVRQPDSGSRKDGPKTLTIHITAEK